MQTNNPRITVRNKKSGNADVGALVWQLLHNRRVIATRRQINPAAGS